MGKKLTLLLYCRVQIMFKNISLQADIQVFTSTPETYKSILNPKQIEIIARTSQENKIGKDFHVVMATDVLSDNNSSLLDELAASIQPSGFIILEETKDVDKESLNRNEFLLFVCKQKAANKNYILLKKKEEQSEPSIIRMGKNSLSWLKRFKATIKYTRSKGQTTIIVSQNDKLQGKNLLFQKIHIVHEVINSFKIDYEMNSIGIVGLMNCIRKEHGCSNARYCFIQDDGIKHFRKDSPLFANQLDKQLTANILRNGQWGSLRHLRLVHEENVPSKLVENAFINTINSGDLKSTKWIESPLRYHLTDKIMNICYVYYSAINFRYE